jgi:hypothetical protein
MREFLGGPFEVPSRESNSTHLTIIRSICGNSDPSGHSGRALCYLGFLGRNDIAHLFGTLSGLIGSWLGGYSSGKNWTADRR